MMKLRKNVQQSFVCPNKCLDLQLAEVCLSSPTCAKPFVVHSICVITSFNFKCVNKDLLLGAAVHVPMFNTELKAITVNRKEPNKKKIKKRTEE